MVRLLIIDDDPDITEILSLYGDFLGYNADMAFSWQEAEKNLSGSRLYNAVFCDLNLRGLNGLQVFEKIHEMDSGLADRFVLLTGAILDDGVEEGIRARKIKLVKKPFNFEDIKAVLQSMEGPSVHSRDIILQSATLPAVPAVVVKILELTGKENTTIEDLQRTIMADSSLTTRVLQMANSAFFGFRQGVETISDAIKVLGFNTIRSVTLAVSTMDIYRPFGPLEEKLWEHSLGVSLAAGAIARGRMRCWEEASIAGLLHDTGKVVMKSNQPDRYHLLLRSVQEDKVPFHTVETEVFGFGHAEAGSLLGEKWGFPEMLSGAIRHHHNWKSFDKGVSADVRQICLAVALADALCTRLGIGYDSPMPEVDLGERELQGLLGIEDGRYEEIVYRFKEDFLREKMLFR
ncbi:MAG: HDOD domain-containing protein [Nitrospiraceae bacterium]|nr:HDOD domain-containing protein [Nitrospiraceae bacterium]